MALFQPAGNVYLRELDDDLEPGVARAICPDTVTISPKVDSWTHVNKCGPTPVEDARGINSLSCEFAMTFPTREARDQALATLGTVVAGSSGTVTVEALPNPIAVGDVYFLGGKERHRNITNLVLGALVANTDFTLDAVTGKVTFLTDQDASPPLNAAYSYDDPKSVSMLTAASKEYAMDMEYIDKQRSNRKGSLEIFRLRPDPADSLDFMPDKEQSLSIKGSCLADTSRDATDTVLGQFGRIVNLED